MWDPAQYARFDDHRSRPFFDLLARVNMPEARAVVDLGAGPGNLTATLAGRWPAARVIGVDSSAEMLAAAAQLEVPGRLEFVLADMAAWQPDGPVDVVVANASLQWVGGHLLLLQRFASWLAPGGVIAIQVPGNFGAPSHREVADLAASEEWRDVVGDTAGRPGAHEPSDYLEALAALGLAVDVWETTYLHVLSGANPVVEWIKGTALRPVLARLDDRQRDRFLAELGDRLEVHYPTGPHGTLFPFRRIFAVARRPGRSQPAVVTGLDHVQLAMPPGGEDRARAFFSGMLGLSEQPKPATLAGRGGCWFAGHQAEIHLGVEADFRPARKAHVGLRVDDVDEMAGRLAGGGHPVTWDEELAPRRRFYCDDPFGNRLEVLGPPA